MRKSDCRERAMLAWIAAVILVLALCLTSPAWADCPPNTRDLDTLKGYMERTHGEHPRVMGWMHGKTLIIYINPETRAWTVFVVNQAMTCASPVASGIAWTEMDLPPVGDPS